MPMLALILLDFTDAINVENWVWIVLVISWVLDMFSTGAHREKVDSNNVQLGVVKKDLAELFTKFNYHIRSHK